MSSGDGFFFLRGIPWQEGEDEFRVDRLTLSGNSSDLPGYLSLRHFSGGGPQRTPIARDMLMIYLVSKMDRSSQEDESEHFLP